MASNDPPPPASSAEMAPDPDEDDLDDLDDVLDEFSATKITPTKPAAPAPSGPGRPAPTAAAGTTSASDPAATTDEDDFAKQLQAGMAELLGELESNPEMAKQFEEMMGQFGAMPGVGGPAAAATSDAPAATASAAAGASAGTEDAFQETIKRTMQRMQHSDTSASAAATTEASASGEEAMFAQMLKEMQAGGGLPGVGGAGGDDSFSTMLLSMMEQLTNKEVLYEPMKELDTKFPPWLAEREPGASKAGEVPEADMVRYREQRRLVAEIVGRFEREGYDDGVSEDREFIVERMQKMQEAGAPPTELVGDVDAAEKMVGDLDLDAGCPQQ